MSTPSCRSIKYAKADLGGVNVEGWVVASPTGDMGVDVDAELDSDDGGGGSVESVDGGKG